MAKLARRVYRLPTEHKNMAPKKLSKKQKGYAIAQLQSQLASGGAVEDGSEDKGEEVDAPAGGAGDGASSVTASTVSGGATAASADVDSAAAGGSSGQSVFEKALAMLSLTYSQSKRGHKNTRGTEMERVV